MGVGGEDALIPATGALGEMGVIADGVQGGLEDAMLPGLAVLGHIEDVGDAVAAEFMDELRRRSGRG